MEKMWSERCSKLEKLFREALKSKDFKSAQDLLLSESEFIRNNNGRAYRRLKSWLFAPQDQDWHDIEFSDLVIEFMNLGKEQQNVINQSVIEQLKMAVARRDLDSIVSLLNSDQKICLAEIEDDQTGWLADLALGRWGNIDNSRIKILEVLIKNGLNTTWFKGGFDEEKILHKFIVFFARKADHDVVDVVKLLLDSGVPLNEVNFPGYNILHCATILGNMELLKFLVEEKNMDVNAGDKLGISPLHLHVLEKLQVDYEVLDYLVSKGADVNNRSNNGYLSVVYFAKKNKPLVFDYLIKNGAEDVIEDPMAKCMLVDDAGRSWFCTSLMFQSDGTTATEPVAATSGDD